MRGDGGAFRRFSAKLWRCIDVDCLKLERDGDRSGIAGATGKPKVELALLPAAPFSPPQSTVCDVDDSIESDSRCRLNGIRPAEYKEVSEYRLPIIIVLSHKRNNEEKTANVN